MSSIGFVIIEPTIYTNKKKLRNWDPTQLTQSHKSINFELSWVSWSARGLSCTPVMQNLKLKEGKQHSMEGRQRPVLRLENKTQMSTQVALI